MSRHWLAAVLLALPAAVSAQHSLGDPTRPTSLSEPDESAEKATQAVRWRLQSTLIADDRKVAVINGRTVSQGERIEGATLLEVRSDGVTLQEDGQRRVLRLPGRIDVRSGG